MITFTPEEVAQHKLKIPTEQEIDEILDKMEAVDPFCGANSGSEINGNGFCSCSRESPSHTPSCQAC